MSTIPPDAPLVVGLPSGDPPASPPPAVIHAADRAAQAILAAPQQAAQGALKKKDKKIIETPDISLTPKVFMAVSPLAPSTQAEEANLAEHLPIHPGLVGASRIDGITMGLWQLFQSHLHAQEARSAKKSIKSIRNERALCQLFSRTYRYVSMLSICLRDNEVVDSLIGYPIFSRDSSSGYASIVECLNEANRDSLTDATSSSEDISKQLPRPLTEAMHACLKLLKYRPSYFQERTREGALPTLQQHLEVSRSFFEQCGYFLHHFQDCLSPSEEAFFSKHGLMSIYETMRTELGEIIERVLGSFPTADATIDSFYNFYSLLMHAYTFLPKIDYGSKLGSAVLGVCQQDTQESQCFVFVAGCLDRPLLKAIQYGLMAFFQRLPNTPKLPKIHEQLQHLATCITDFQNWWQQEGSIELETIKRQGIALKGEKSHFQEILEYNCNHFCRGEQQLSILLQKFQRGEVLKPQTVKVLCLCFRLYHTMVTEIARYTLDSQLQLEIFMESSTPHLADISHILSRAIDLKNLELQTINALFITLEKCMLGEHYDKILECKRALTYTKTQPSAAAVHHKEKQDVVAAQAAVPGSKKKGKSAQAHLQSKPKQPEREDVAAKASTGATKTQHVISKVDAVAVSTWTTVSMEEPVPVALGIPSIEVVAVPVELPYEEQLKIWSEALQQQPVQASSKQMYQSALNNLLVCAEQLHEMRHVVFSVDRVSTEIDMIRRSIEWSLQLLYAAYMPTREIILTHNLEEIARAIFDHSGTPSGVHQVINVCWPIIHLFAQGNRCVHYPYCKGFSKRQQGLRDHILSTREILTAHHEAPVMRLQQTQERLIQSGQECVMALLQAYLHPSSKQQKTPALPPYEDLGADASDFMDVHQIQSGTHKETRVLEEPAQVEQQPLRPITSVSHAKIAIVDALKWIDLRMQTRAYGKQEQNGRTKLFQDALRQASLFLVRLQDKFEQPPQYLLSRTLGELDLAHRSVKETLAAALLYAEIYDEEGRHCMLENRFDNNPRYLASLLPSGYSLPPAPNYLGFAHTAISYPYPTPYTSPVGPLEPLVKEILQDHESHVALKGHDQDTTVVLKGRKVTHQSYDKIANELIERVQREYIYHALGYILSVLRKAFPVEFSVLDRKTD